MAANIFAMTENTPEEIKKKILELNNMIFNTTDRKDKAYLQQMVGHLLQEVGHLRDKEKHEREMEMAKLLQEMKLQEQTTSSCKLAHAGSPSTCTLSNGM